MQTATGNILVDTGRDVGSGLSTGPSRSFVVDFRACATLPPGPAKAAAAAAAPVRCGRKPVDTVRPAVDFHRAAHPTDSRI